MRWGEQPSVICLLCRQVHQCCGLPGSHYEAGNPRRKRVCGLPHIWNCGIASSFPHPPHYWAHRPKASFCSCKYRGRSGLLNHSVHPRQWVIIWRYNYIWLKTGDYMYIYIFTLSLISSTDLFWLKSAVACVGRLGITMAFEMVVFVNTELYPTVIRWDLTQRNYVFLFIIHHR